MKNEQIIEQSEWWVRIRKAVEEGLLPVTGDFMLVEKLVAPEKKTKGGIIIADVDTHRNTIKDRTTELGLVLAVGPGQVFEDGEVLKPRFEPGDVVLLPNNVEWYDVFFWAKARTQIGRLRDSQVPMGTVDLTRLQKLFDEEVV